MSRGDASLVLSALEKMNSVLAVIDFNPAGSEPEDPEVEEMVAKRDEARERKDYGEADRIREQLRKRHIILEDSPYGTMFWKENSPKGD